MKLADVLAVEGRSVLIKCCCDDKSESGKGDERDQPPRPDTITRYRHCQ